MDSRNTPGYPDHYYPQSSIVRIGIIGGGESGVGAALLALKVGDEPYVSDYGLINPVYRQSLIENNVRFEENGHTFDILVASDIIIKSPGVRDETPIIKSLKAHGLIIISELEYGARHCHGLIVAITGSNGKTTTTNLVYHILNLAGKSVMKGGNLGICLSTLLLEKAVEIYVLEVSSFQLDDIVSFKPEIAVLLNITPDHLDRYAGQFEFYADSKLKITMNQSSSEYFIYNGDDEMIMQRISNVTAQCIPVISDSLAMDDFSIANPYLRGRHNRFNTSCAIEVVRRLHISNEQILKGLETFRNDDHRLQTVAVINGVEWINDSKATNVDATYYALEAMSLPLIWIAGGQDKGNDYDRLKPLVRSKVKMVLCLGKDNTKLLEEFGNLSVPIAEVHTMDEAIVMAEQHSEEGDTVLLSPACASFDLFENYKDRGSQFVSCVWKLLRKRK